MKHKKSSRTQAVPALFVCTPSARADQTAATLQAKGLSITRADNVCFAEIYADAQRFEAAIYDQSLSQEEQASLARVMRIRWPWMRIMRWVSPGAALLDDDLFDWSVRSEPELAACVELRLTS
jgi:hypothetical protein